jgi:predicted MPP superfamily phosphohydrolase
MKWFVLIFFFAAIASDVYLYRSLLRGRSLWARIAYILFALLTDGAALTALMLYGAAADRGSVGVVVVMWAVWLFLLALVPKLLYSVGGVLDMIMRWVLRRRVILFRAVGLVAAAVTMGVMIWGATVGRTQLRVEEVEMCSPRVPEAFDGYRIVQFSDVHIGTMTRPERQLERLVRTIDGLGGDMVVNTGDLVNLVHSELTPELAAILSRIEAPDGVWSVWGNHDLGFYLKRGAELTPEQNLAALAGKVRGMGWQTLSDSSVWIHRGGDSLLLTGIKYPLAPHNGHNSDLGGVDLDAAFEGTTGSPFNVVLSHTPILWDEITDRDRGDVTLSGHVHAMQTKLRLGAKEWSPAQFMYKEWSGSYFVEKYSKKMLLYINDGIGCVGYPMRIGANGEVTVITLKRCE